MEVQLVSSRDLIHWERLGDRQPFIPLGTITDWDRSMIMPFTSNHIVRDGKLSTYYGGSKHAHRPNSYWNKPGQEYPDDIQGMGLATIREDGFISLDADASGGVITTKPVRFDGNRLVINADAIEGSVDIEVLDLDGNTITG